MTKGASANTLRSRLNRRRAWWFHSLLLSLLIFFPREAFAETKATSLSDTSLLQIRFEQKLNGSVPLDLVFRDESGRPVALNEFSKQRPAIFILGYYGCPMLCTLVLNGLIESMQDMSIKPGRDFEIINVSIDPREQPPLAAAKKRSYLKRYGRLETEGGWHFLTGDERSVAQLADALGFRYAYDRQANQYAHPSGLVVVTADGRISSYLFGVQFAAQDLAASLKTASARKIGSPIQELFLLCFRYSPLRGKYGPLIMELVRWASGLTLAAIAFGIFRQRRASVSGVEQTGHSGAVTREDV